MTIIEAAIIEEKVSALKESVDAWKVSHDKRSDERWVDIMDKLQELKNDIRSKDCKEHATIMLELNGRVKNIEKWQGQVGWAVGVLYSAVVAAVVAFAVKHILKN